MLKLPKSLQDHPSKDAIEAYFTGAVAPLHPEAPVLVTHRPFDKALHEALKVAFGTSHLLQGLELIETALNREERGLAMVRAKSGQAIAHRLSRLLIVANDGTTRFYRDVGAVLHHHGDRTWCLKVDITGHDLGRALTTKGGPAKALLVDDKDAVSMMLARLVSK